ncbi:MAG TPA: hypothetical protein VMV18_08305 [bacterium]|nr:hypothetical protein [bacterium]
MKLAELAVIYAVVGVGLAVWLLSMRGLSHGMEAALLVPFWPLVAPFALAREAPRINALGSLLPDAETAERVTRRLARVEGKIGEIDRLLSDPAFSERSAEKRWHELVAGDDAELAMTAKRTLDNVRRLRSLRAKLVHDFEHVHELLGQLRVQAEVVRLAGEPETGVRELVQELLDQVESLDEVLSAGHDAAG